MEIPPTRQRLGDPGRASRADSCIFSCLCWLLHWGLYPHLLDSLSTGTLIHLERGSEINHLFCAISPGTGVWFRQWGVCVAWKRSHVSTKENSFPAGKALMEWHLWLRELWHQPTGPWRVQSTYSQVFPASADGGDGPGIRTVPTDCGSPEAFLFITDSRRYPNIHKKSISFGSRLTAAEIWMLLSPGRCILACVWRQTNCSHLQSSRCCAALADE